MGKSTIEWTDYTFNPWTGCVEVSPACDNCYARGMASRLAQKWAVGAGTTLETDKVWGKANDRLVWPFDHDKWQEPIRWNKSAERAYLKGIWPCDRFESGARPSMDDPYGCLERPD